MAQGVVSREKDSQVPDECGERHSQTSGLRGEMGLVQERDGGRRGATGLISERTPWSGEGPAPCGAHSLLRSE